MLYVRTRSGRYMSAEHIIGFAIEDQFVEITGKRIRVYNVIAYLPGDLNPAVLAMYRDLKSAQQNLDRFIQKLLSAEKGIVTIDTEI